MVEIRDHSFENAMTSLMSEMYKLAIKHMQLSGRSHIQPQDIQNALKVVLLPSYGYRSSMKPMTHIEDINQFKNDKDARSLTLESMTMASRFMGKVMADEELGNDSVTKECKEVQKQEKKRLEQEQEFSLFPKQQKLSGVQVATAIGTISNLLQASDMPETTEEEFCFCSDEVQSKHNDMFLMERADVSGRSTWKSL